VTPTNQIVLDIASPLLKTRKQFALDARSKFPNQDIVVPRHPLLETEKRPVRKHEALREVGHIVAVCSGKGGVGKSTVSSFSCKVSRL
jgi:Mrp family chromosome partitioning ATPase